MNKPNIGLSIATNIEGKQSGQAKKKKFNNNNKIKMWKYSYMLEMNMRLAGNVIHNVSDILLPAATDEVLLRDAVLGKILSDILSSADSIAFLFPRIFARFSKPVCVKAI